MILQPHLFPLSFAGSQDPDPNLHETCSNSVPNSTLEATAHVPLSPGGRDELAIQEIGI